MSSSRSGYKSGDSSSRRLPEVLQQNLQRHKVCHAQIRRQFSPEANSKGRLSVCQGCTITNYLHMQPTGNESLVEKWILHKLNAAAEEVNKYLLERNFMMVTSSAYNFWLYELCDVYIVGLLYSISTLIWFADYYLPGSNETDDRRVCACCHSELSSSNTLHMSRLWPSPFASFDAVRHRGALAAPETSAKRCHAVHHGLIIPNFCRLLNPPDSIILK